MRQYYEAFNNSCTGISRENVASSASSLGRDAAIDSITSAGTTLSRTLIGLIRLIRMRSRIRLKILATKLIIVRKT